LLIKSTLQQQQTITTTETGEPFCMSKARAKKIKVLLFDVDGVLTDGGIWLFPAPAGAVQATQSAAADKADAGGYAIVSQNMVEAKGFHAHDGTGFYLARLGGLKTGLVTKRISETVRLRARDLRVDHILQGISDKRRAIEEIMEKENVRADEVAFVGDDIIDLPAMRMCGLAIAVPNGREQVKDEAHIVTDHPGGYGAARDAVEYILNAQNKLDAAIDAYLNEKNPAKPVLI
jgi:3-deoxy-D-manno-octulosonate 8-phosphate phosphatase (KDO 8-P phosphatase)